MSSHEHASRIERPTGLTGILAVSSQLCINFTNEKLQSRFNAHTFTQELAVYEAEGIEFTPIPFLDNTPVLT